MHAEARRLGNQCVVGPHHISHRSTVQPLTTALLPHVSYHYQLEPERLVPNCSLLCASHRRELYRTDDACPSQSVAMTDADSSPVMSLHLLFCLSSLRRALLALRFVL